MLQQQLQDQIESIDVKQDVLGISVSYEDYQEAHNRVLKIVRVHRGSPAERLMNEEGEECQPLRAQEDFILAAQSKAVLEETSYELRKPLVFKDIQ